MGPSTHPAHVGTPCRLPGPAVAVLASPGPEHSVSQQPGCSGTALAPRGRQRSTSRRDKRVHSSRLGAASEQCQRSSLSSVARARLPQEPALRQALSSVGASVSPGVEAVLDLGDRQGLSRSWALRLTSFSYTCSCGCTRRVVVLHPDTRTRLTESALFLPTESALFLLTENPVVGSDLRASAGLLCDHVHPLRLRWVTWGHGVQAAGRMSARISSQPVLSPRGRGREFSGEGIRSAP